MARELEITKEQVHFLLKKASKFKDVQNMEIMLDDGDAYGCKIKEENGTIIMVKKSNYGRDLYIYIKPPKTASIERYYPLPTNFLTKMFSRTYWLYFKAMKSLQQVVYNDQNSSSNVKIQEVSRVIDQAYPNEIEKELLS